MSVKISPFAPKSFKKTQKINGISVSSIHCGLKNKNKKDLVLIKFDKTSRIYGVFSNSQTPGEPVIWNKSILKYGKVSAILINSGNANVFNGRRGKISQKKIVKKLSKEIGLKENEIYTASTGVIGEPLDHKKILDKIPTLIKNLNNEPDSWLEAAEAIKTTDTYPKLDSTRLKTNKSIIINGIAKGSGMIAPNMATMLSFIFTNAVITEKNFSRTFREIVDETFNSITVDGETSTSDMVLFISVRNKEKKSRLENFSKSEFKKSLKDLMLKLAQSIVKDGEGASKFISISVKGLSSHDKARKVAFSVANSPLVKTAMAGSDLNWGRIVMAIGKSGIKVNEKEISIKFGNYFVIKKGKDFLKFSLKKIERYLRKKEIEISIQIGASKNQAKVWTCDLTEGYISINTDYRS